MRGDVREDMAEQPIPAAAGTGSRRRRRLRTGLAWTAVGSWAAWAAVRLAGADGMPGVGVPVVPLLSLTPYVAATSPAPLVLAALLRRWRAAAVAAAVAGGLFVAVVPRAVGSGGPTATGPALRVLSANLWVGRADAEAIVELVRRTDTDVLCVQELTQAAVNRLERAGLTRLLPHRNLAPSANGGRGAGIYSRHRLRVLPPVAGSTVVMPWAELTLPGGARVEVLSVHPLPPLTRQAAQNWSRDLAALPSAGDDEPVRVLAGDFNATLDHARFRALVGRGYFDAADRAGKGLVPTWGFGRRDPALTIDHVLASERVGVQRVEVHHIPTSDHRALFAELRLPAP